MFTLPECEDFVLSLFKGIALKYSKGQSIAP